MTASGPFAMGPATTSVRRAAPTTVVVPNRPATSLDSGLVPVKLEPTATSLSVKGKGKARDDRQSLSETPALSDIVKKEEDDYEVYSDPDEGVEIVDMDDVKTLDYMAPDSIRREREAKARVKKEKVEEKDSSVTPPIDASNALDLSDSEEEEELEDFVEDFTFKADVADGTPSFEDRLYFFQLPAPFPIIVQPMDGMDVDQAPQSDGRHVSFAPDVKPAAVPASGVTVKKEPGIKKEPVDCILDGTEHLDGVIGTLLVRQSGRIQMQLGNGAIYDVTPSTQPSFHQAAVHIGYPEPKPPASAQPAEGTPPVQPALPTMLTTLGPVTRHFSVTPSISQLLAALEQKDQEERSRTRIRGLGEDAEAGLISMD